MAPYFRLVTSESIFEARSLSEKPQPFSELPSLASSNWSREHLFAARIIRCEAQNNLLPLYSQNLTAIEGQYPPEIVKFLEGPNMEHMGQSEHFLVQSYGHSLGQAWAALAAFKGPPSRRGVASNASGDNEAEPSSETRSEGDSEGLSRVKRVRRGTPEGFVNSSLIQVGSSSPADDHSHGTLDSSVGYVDGGSDGSMPLEEETVRLVSCVFRHILYSTQSLGSMPLVVEFRDARMRYAALMPLIHRRVVAIDDGGLCMRQQMGSSFVLTKNQVAVLEAKRRFQLVEDGRPVISDECFAQMACEAITARLVDPLEELWHENVIIVNATQNYVCFLQFEITDAYLQQFDSESPSLFLHVHSTPWFDLSSRGGREHVLSNLCALIHWART
ncbi:hypothetical protein CEP51_009257 [Fusarium floridanum]|uniref:Uncharacterized protein n=1 Tax=Fusarium floridanum TaxID=1325733 RepID=A0A428RI79_9HYPO|nr:hypothetical protein CEP51_009257 [Fusarium floridanum]